VWTAAFVRAAVRSAISAHAVGDAHVQPSLNHWLVTEVSRFILLAMASFHASGDLAERVVAVVPEQSGGIGQVVMSVLAI
jgi:hypothetical protein